VPPRVSVVVPVLDGAGCIDRCLEALLAQTYPSDRLELIVVDNGSRDGTPERVRRHPVTLLVERSERSPYAARNAGIRRAGGEVLAFTDADCVPAKDWLERGVAALERQAADLVGGHVRFRFGGRPGAAQLMDAVTNLDQERSVAERGVAKTGNLLVRRSVVEALGPFQAGRRSGGDVEFTGRATGAGFALVYAADAVVEKPARGALALARKQYRVGRGQALLSRERGAGAGEILRRALRGLRPARPAVVRAGLERRGPAGCEGRTAAVWLTSWWIHVVHAAGLLHGWLGGAGGRR